MNVTYATRNSGRKDFSNDMKLYTAKKIASFVHHATVDLNTRTSYIAIVNHVEMVENDVDLLAPSR